MNYSKIIKCDIANGEGVRVSLFVSGCTHHCKGCFNPSTWDFESGEEYTHSIFSEIADEIDKAQVDGVSILGGEPLDQDEDGIERLLTLTMYAHASDKNVWLWTGYKWEDFADMSTLKKSLIASCDIIVDGEFIEEKKDLGLAFRGSSNQRIIDVKASLANNKIILYKGSFK